MYISISLQSMASSYNYSVNLCAEEIRASIFVGEKKRKKYVLLSKLAKAKVLLCPDMHECNLEPRRSKALMALN